MDAGLFGEHILTTLKHAWDNLLLPPKSSINPEVPHGCVIPHGATVYAVPIQCPYIRKRNIFFGEDKLYLKQLNLCSTTNEPYDCEKLNQLPGDYIFLAKPQAIMDINFNDPCQINSLLNSQNLNIMKSLKYSITQSGNVDAIVSWFVIKLAEDITINTFDEKNENCCWEQALFVSKTNRRVNQGDKLYIQYKWQGDHYILKLEDEIQNSKFIPLEKEIISFLNDNNQVDNYAKAAKNWYLNNKSFKNVNVLDTCPFPIFGLELLCLASTDNNFNVDIYYTDKNLTDVLKKVTNSKSSNSNIYYFDRTKLIKFDVIIINYINFFGELNINSIENQIYTAKMLKPHGIILPEKLLIKCQLVNSKWLPQVSKVVESNRSCNSHIRDLMNTYSVNHHLDVFKHLVTNICLSDCKTCLTLLPKQMCQEMSSLIKIPIKTSGQLNTILYFFELIIYENCNVSTANENSYVNQCAFLIDHTVNVSPGYKVKINTMFNSGHLLLSIDHF